MKKLIEDLRSTDMKLWRKKAGSAALTGMSLIIPYIVFLNYESLLSISTGFLLTISSLAIVRTLLTFLGGYYLIKNALPKYVLLGFSILVYLNVFWSGIAIVLISVKA